MKTIRNLINDQNNNISFCGDTEEILKEDALNDIKELENHDYRLNPEEVPVFKNCETIVRFIRFKHNLNDD